MTDSAKLREDLERARVAFENAWRRLVDMIVNLQKDMMRKRLSRLAPCAVIAGPTCPPSPRPRRN